MADLINKTVTLTDGPGDTLGIELEVRIGKMSSYTLGRWFGNSTTLMQSALVEGLAAALWERSPHDLEMLASSLEKADSIEVDHLLEKIARYLPREDT